MKTLVNQSCVFCRDTRKSPMYEIEQLLINVGSSKLECIHDFSVFQDGTTLYINYDAQKEEVRNEIISLFYVNITAEKYSSELFLIMAIIW